jgi:hypothetical protein
LDNVELFYKHPDVFNGKVVSVFHEGVSKPCKNLELYSTEDTSAPAALE